ncbi:MAG: RagB/SusD family nutrient uptake outer membrane protein, partial [Prevotellaceae bacterium]|nr:RagB/SusD family nutrient uptake outer membrane protein [Prevotellaceae bacterium]
MKKIGYFILTIALLGGAAACTEILDTAPYNELSSGSMWTSEELVDQGVIGVYYSLQRPMQGGQIVGEAVDIGYYGFDVLGMSGQGSYAINGLFTETVNPGNTRFSFTWKWCYDGVHRANDAIANIPNAPLSDEKKGRLIAECKILRAFFYSRLNELFGGNGLGVPLYTEPVSPSECNRVQTPEADVWKQVIADLTDAISEPALPNNQIQGEGRASKGAAYALRGRTYLIAKDYENAIADFAKVGECGYSLFAPTGTDADYKQLFKVANERCEEMILSVQYIEDPAGYGSRLQKYCAPFQGGA